MKKTWLAMTMAAAMLLGSACTPQAPTAEVVLQYDAPAITITASQPTATAVYTYEAPSIVVTAKRTPGTKLASNG